MSQYERSYILLNLRVGKKKEKGLLKSTTKVEVLPGTLLNFLERSGNLENYVFETVDSENVEVSCAYTDFTELSKEQYELLLPIPVLNERLTTFNNKEWLQEGSSLKLGDGVEVYIKGQAKDFVGILRYKGPVEGVPGIYFGVELINNPGIGNSDGVFRKHRFFTCKPDTAVFVGLHRIRKCVSPSNQSHRAPRKVEGAEGGYMNHAPMAGLSVNTRVVWVSDTGPEAGVVKWIGLLPGADQRNEDFTVGGEFDNPVGSGTGKYKDQRLFSAKQGHASLVPILGRKFKEAEFLGQEIKSGITSTSKKDVLQAVTEKFNASGNGKRSSDEVDKKWGNMVTKHRALYSEGKRHQMLTGGGPAGEKIGILTEAVMDVVGKESVNVTGIVGGIDTSEMSFLPFSTGLEEESSNSSLSSCFQPSTFPPPSTQVATFTESSSSTLSSYQPTPTPMGTRKCCQCEDCSTIKRLKKQKMQLQIKLLQKKLNLKE